MGAVLRDFHIRSPATTGIDTEFDTKRKAKNLIFSVKRRKASEMFPKFFAYSRHGEAVNSRAKRGFTLLELMIVIAISVGVAAYAIPMFLNAYYDIRLKAACSDLSGLMQKARIQSARENAVFTVAYRTSTVEEAYIDMNNDGSWDTATINGIQQEEPIIDFNQSITMAAGAPSGTGAPTPYVLVGDSGNTVFTNTTTLGYSARGLPCAYTLGVCSTPAGGYFVYYVKDQRPNSVGWGAVVITRSGRSKVVIWNGVAWQ